MEGQDPHILILVHNNATTNAKADAMYREQALAHQSFAGRRIDLENPLTEDVEAITSEELMEGIEEEAGKAQKRPLSFHSSQEEEEQTTRRPRKRALVDSQSAAHTDNSPVYIPMSTFEGLSEPPLAYSLSPSVIRSSAIEASTFVCEPGFQQAFTLEPITPQMPNLSVVPETILRPASQTSPLATRQLSSPIQYDESIDEIPCTFECEVEQHFQKSFNLDPANPTTPRPTNISVIPETILRPGCPKPQLGDSQQSSPIEYDDSPLEIPDSQPTRPKGKGIVWVAVDRSSPSNPSDRTNTTHVSQSPPVAIEAGGKRQIDNRQMSFLQRLAQTKVHTAGIAAFEKEKDISGEPVVEVPATEAVAVVQDATIASIIEVSPVAADKITPNPRRVIQIHPPPPKLSSLSPVSPLQHSIPETLTSPDKLPKRFPLFTGQPVSPRSLLAYMLEKDLDSVDRALLEKDRYNVDKQQINRFLELRQLSEYNISSPAPAVDSNPKQITPLMEKLYTRAKLDKYYRPRDVSREMRKRERGFWRLDLSRWPRPRVIKENGGVPVKSTAERKHEFWSRLGGYVRDGKLGETRLYFESESEGAGEQVGDILRLYCYGEVAVHIWVILYAISDRIISELGLKWIDAGGTVVIEM
ncbi:hypothetical protein ABW19_dt0202115 [Dactylella cylindrospora]|nr:hypothetical protein ABW19_dt0202115 [Dactylella cylindrospora]